MERVIGGRNKILMYLVSSYSIGKFTFFVPYSTAISMHNLGFIWLNIDYRHGSIYYLLRILYT